MDHISNAIFPKPKPKDFILDTKVQPIKAHSMTYPGNRDLDRRTWSQIKVKFLKSMEKNLNSWPYL